MTLCLRMTIGERHYLLGSSTIETVLALGSIEIERSENGDIGGTAVISDRVVTLIDIRKIVFGKPTRFFLNTRILIPSASALNTCKYGFIVEKALDLVRIERQQLGHDLPDLLLFDGVPCHFLSLVDLVEKHTGANRG